MPALKDQITSYGIGKALDYLDGDFRTNAPKLLDWLERFDRTQQATVYPVVRKVLSDPGNNWNRQIAGLYQDIDAHQRKTLLRNLFINACVIGNRHRHEVMAREGCNVPWAILMDPTTACNLTCIGCWAADYGHKLRMSFETLDSIVEQGKAMGTYAYLFSGGEPLIRKKDIIRLWEKHSDCAFLSFTNGTFIDEKFADEVKRVGNFLPAISIEGSEELTDARRGTGTYQAVVRAMNLLRERGLLFGFSTCYTSQNVESVGSDEYVDEMIALGCKFGWYFTYMPVGNGSPTDLMATDEQRAFMYRQVRRIRDEKPIFLLDFWNDGEYVGGCVAGGRRYLHINANGDVEPCAFIHYANTNIHDVSLLEALKSPLFAEYRKGQPFNENMLRPCPLLDNPGALAAMVHRSAAHSTDMSSPEDVDALTDKCRPAAERWATASAEIWWNSPAGQRCLACRQGPELPEPATTATLAGATTRGAR